LFGGAGDDTLVGDSDGKTDAPGYVALDAHGADYIDGEEGNDSIEGGTLRHWDATKSTETYTHSITTAKLIVAPFTMLIHAVNDLTWRMTA
jgi:Ca2+-binding RTX toxin-like protein